VMKLKNHQPAEHRSDLFVPPFLPPYDVSSLEAV